MSPQGPFYAGTAADTGTNAIGAAATAWVNPSNATGAADGVFTTDTWITGGGASNGLKLTNFGFSIPSTAIIDGIYIEFDRQGSAAATYQINLVKAGTIQTTGAKGGTDSWPSVGNEAWVGYGGSTDTWGQTWQPSDINNSGFGLVIYAYNTHGGGEGYVDAARITIYWHTAPANVVPRFLYQVFDNKGNYLGLLPNVTSDFEYAQDINTSGAQTTIVCAGANDASFQTNGTVDDETGIALQDESGNNITLERVPDIVGNSNNQILFRNGNRIKVYMSNYYYPNGKLMFQGQINRWEANFGAPDGNDEIKLLCYSDGADMNNFVLTGGGTLDQSQTSENSSFGLYYDPNTKVQNYQMAGQSFQIGSVTSFEAIAVMLSTGGHNDQVTVTLYSGDPTGNMTQLAQSSQIVNAVNPTAFTFVFAPILTVTAGEKMFFSVQSSLTPGNTVIYYQNSNVYANGQMYESSYSGNGVLGWSAQPSLDLYFQTFSGGAATTVTYSSLDPSTMLTDIIQRYNQFGGLIQASSSNIANTGLTATYTFVVATVLEGIQEALALAPANWFWYVDATDNIYFNQVSASAQLTFVKGRHIRGLNVIATIENIINTLYFSGGLVSGNNLYGLYQNTSSISSFGQRVDRQSDNRVTTNAVADLIGNSAVGEKGVEQYQTQVTIMASSMDITLITLGMAVGFAGFGNFIDQLVLQVVRVEFHPEYVTLTLGVLPPRINAAAQQALNGLVALQTINNPSTPTA